MISRSKVISWLVAIITFGALVGIEFAFRKPLFSRTLTFIHKFQSHTKPISMKVWSQFSDTGVATLPAIILLMTIDYRQRSRQVYYFMMFTIILFVMSITKIAYREARPFWIDPTVYQKDCSSEFGNPSGHSMTASALSFTLALDIASLIKGSLYKVIIVQLVLFLISTVYFLGIGFSRLVLGVHSLNQVVYGWLIGLWIAFFCHFVIREQLKTRVEQFLKKGNLHWKDATAVSVAYVFVIGAQVATFYIVDSQKPISANWAIIVATLCKIQADQAFQSESFKAIGLTFAFLSAYLGVIAQSKVFEGQKKLRISSSHKILKYLGRLGLLIVFVIPWAALLLFAKLENIWLNMLFKKGLSVFGICFSITFVYDWVCAKIKLYDSSSIATTIDDIQK